MSRATNLLRCVAVSLAFAGASATSVFAQGDTGQSFSDIRETHLRQAIAEVAAYVKEHPEAADTEAAQQWLFETALEHGLETETLESARDYSDSGSTVEAVRNPATRVLGVGLAKSGRIEEALDVFERHLLSSRLRNPAAVVDFGLALVAECQLSNNVDAATGILERLKDTFFLNPSVRQLCEDRLLKLQLLGQQAPEISTISLDGDPIDLADYRGRVVLVDFWATNCAPCLEEFPEIKQLYNDRSGQGFEIIGISLDAEPSTVDEFQQKWHLPWLLAMNNSDHEQTRERYRVRTIPSLFVVGRSGKIDYVDVRGDALRRAVESLLDEK